MSKSTFRKPISPKTAKEELFDALLGADEELSQKVASDILDSYDMTGEQLVNRFKTRLQEKIKQVHDETGTIPKRLEATLKNVRGYQKVKQPRSVGAAEWIAGIFDWALMPSEYAEAQFAFRNRSGSELSDNDKRILNELDAELKYSGE